MPRHHAQGSTAEQGCGACCCLRQPHRPRPAGRRAEQCRAPTAGHRWALNHRRRFYLPAPVPFTIEERTARGRKATVFGVRRAVFVPLFSIFMNGSINERRGVYERGGQAAYGQDQGWCQRRGTVPASVLECPFIRSFDSPPTGDRMDGNKCWRSGGFYWYAM